MWYVRINEGPGGGGDWRLHVHVYVWCMGLVYHALSTSLLKAAACMHAKQLIGIGVAALAWQKHALQPHSQDGRQFEQVANAVPIGVHVSQLELQGLMRQNTEKHAESSCADLTLNRDKVRECEALLALKKLHTPATHHASQWPYH